MRKRIGVFAWIFAACILIFGGCASTHQSTTEGVAQQASAGSSLSPGVSLLGFAKRSLMFEEVEKLVLRDSYYLPKDAGQKRRVFSTCMDRYKNAGTDDPTRTNELTEALNACNAEDKWDAYFSPDAWQDFQIGMGTSFGGIGVEIGWDGNKTGLLISNILPGSPLEQLQVHVGDVIRSIRQENETDPVCVEGRELKDLIRLIRGPIGTKVFLEIWRGQECIGTFSVERQEVDPRHIVTKTFNNGTVGYIQFSGFEQDLFREKIRPAIESFIASGVRKIIFDVRGNPGGLIEEPLYLSVGFMEPRAMMLSVCRRDSCKNYIAPEGRALFRDVAVVILIDKKSASASELFAGIMKTHRKAFLIGETTYGKGCVQVVETLYSSPGSAVKITTALFYFDLAHTITPEGNGVAPDLMVINNDPGRDAQLEAALEYFRLMERNGH
ncbi:MAG: hypothetical protein COU47_03635 [Candidatus Niyogibacteria bacterium CG10_big_fil_rev_8_21_14_0_10_46_36]|uniref:PDZ domain-containing protein n=1 Tax=Candidatus Niyogibacteria bacterium CG10_big_fil_rev_8_21_14_0_10_46_36 TaxID=1974726 RepID=A0A2H0TD01_9BACT|nr:MAG: hypothetical protein COU47_03635 [Candidatus Niyogibacteria bacterium CG10_big_fil_rev_8_21_14_0_10_46_36]